MKKNPSHSKKSSASKKTKKHTSKKHYSPKNHKNLCEGIFTRSKRGFGFVDTGDGENDIFVAEQHQKRAIEGDKVQVQLSANPRKKRRHGRIVKILDRRIIRVLATLKRGKDFCIALPLNSDFVQDLIRIQVPDASEEASSSGIAPSDIISGSIVEVELLPHESEGTSGVWGRIIHELNAESSCELGMKQVLLENQICEDFPESVEKQAQDFPSEVLCEENSPRVDQTALDYITIDGPTAQDFDDAVYVEKNGESYRLFVAIADVAHYVTEETAIHEEACRRGTSVYLPTHAIPMLPERLSNELCSLIPQTNRYTLTCEMHLNAFGEVTNHLIYESMIHSRARLIYDDVSDLLAGKPSSIQSSKLQKQLKQMKVLANLLAKKRKKRGSINFQFEETTPIFEEIGSKIPTRFQRSYASSAMGLIEQFMLEANETVARHCVENRLPAPYRIHQAPDANKLKQLRTTFEYFGIKLPKSLATISQQFNVVLEKLKPLDNYEELQVLLLRCMSLACYGTQNQGHFGLAASFYTHFTSPIRRYPDLLVHRALKAEIHQQFTDKKTSSKKKIRSKTSETEGLDSSLMAQLSQKERQAERAESNGKDLIKALFLESHVGEDFEASVSTVQAHGFRIRLLEFDFECFIPLETLEGRYFYDETRLLLSSPKKQHHIRSGDHLRIQLIRVDCFQRTLEFSNPRWAKE